MRADSGERERERPVRQGSNLGDAQCRAPNGHFVDATRKKLRRRVVRKTDVDPLLPVKIRGRLVAGRDEYAVDVDALPPDERAHDVGYVVPSAIGEVLTS